MNDFAAPDYEPSAKEIEDFLADTFGPDDPPLPGQHGNITIIPGFERYLWSFPVFWGDRHVNENGSVSLSWCVPLPCPQDDDS